MRAFLAVARREVSERWAVLVAAAVAGAVAFLVPIARNLHGADAADARQWTALILAACFAVGIAISLGLSTLAGEIVNRRIGFYWSRPIAGLALWAGKLTGVFLLALVAAALAFLPSALIDGRRVLPEDLPSVGPGFLLLALIGLIALSHILGIAARSRSPLLLADCVAAGLAFLATRAICIPLLRLAAGGSAMTNLFIAEVFLGLGALGGGCAAVLIGRTLIGKAHRALSAVLWSVVALGLALQIANMFWITTAKPSSIQSIYLLDPGGARGWVTLMGYARLDNATFAFNVDDGRYARVPTTLRPIAFSRDGQRAVWFESESKHSVTVMSWELKRADATPRPTRLSLPASPGVSFLSADGSRLATYDYELLSVYDLGTGALLGSARAPGHIWTGQGLFVSPDRVRLFLQPYEQDTRIAILDFDLAAKKLRQTGVVQGMHLEPFFTVSPEGDRLIVRDIGASRISLVDGVTGQQTMVLLEESTPTWAPTVFLAGGRIAVATSQGKRIRVLTPDGQIERDIGLPAPVSELLGEPVAGRLSLTLRGSTPGGFNTAGFLDLDSGTFHELTELRAPPGSFWRTRTDPAAPEDDYSAIFSASDGSLVKVDPITLKRRTILTMDNPHR